MVRTASLLADLARIHYLKENVDQALSIWEEAVQTAPTDPNTYRIVYQSLLTVRRFGQAASLLALGREQVGDPALFRIDLAYLYSITGRHEEAMEEYLSLLIENDQHLGFVRSRLSRFLEEGDALQASIAVVERAVRNNPLYRPHRELLGWLYVEARDYANAFDEHRAIDRLEGEDGRVLFQFAQTAADASAYEAASEAYREVLERNPDAPSAPQALAALGDMQERWGQEAGERAFDVDGKRIPAPRHDEALATYHAFLEQYPYHDLHPQILQRIGHLQQNVFLDLESAEATYQQALTLFPNTPSADEAAFDLARVALMRGRLDEAQLRFSRLVEQGETGELAEQARFEQAKIHVYKGELDVAQSLASVIDTHTSNDISNDAIELKLLLMENRGPDSLDTPLRRYAGILLAREQHRPEAALDSLVAFLAQYPSHALVDEARFLQAGILRSMGRSQHAYQAFAELPLLHPRSPVADRALYEAADILELELDDVEGAVDTLQRLLVEYPGSLLGNKARERIRRLRGDGV